LQTNIDLVLRPSTLYSTLLAPVSSQRTRNIQKTYGNITVHLLLTKLFSCTHDRCTRHVFPHNRKFANKYRETVMYIYCCLKCTPAPFTAVLEHAGTCPFTENKKHAENIGNRYCTPLSIKDVLVYPSHMYTTHLTPVPS
jgi:hypothetical protein